MADTSSLKSILLMTAPVVVLGGLGLLFQNRQPAVFTTPAPFQVFIKKVRLVPIKPAEVQDGYDTKIEVELGARGRAAWWWQSGFGGYVSTSEGQVVVDKGGVLSLVAIPWHARPYQEKTETAGSRWITTYLLKLAPIPAKAGEVHLRHRIEFINSNKKFGHPIWLDTVVRHNGQNTQIPTVSHNPQLVIESWSLDEKPPVDNFSGAGGEEWRLSLCFRKKGRLSDVKNTGVDQNLDIRDVKGETSPMWGTTTYHNSAPNMEGASQYGRTHTSNPRLSYFTIDFSDRGTNNPVTNTYFKPKPPLWIEGEASWNGNWPLWVKLPLRDAQDKVLLTPRPAPAFRVISTSIIAPTSEQTTLDGTDTVVQVVLGANNPKTDVSNWDWQGNFSQHIVDAKGRKHWLFPFKSTSPSQPALVRYEATHPGSRITLTYALILSSIPKSVGTLTFHTQISANGSRRVPVSIVVRPAPSNKKLADKPSTPAKTQQ